MKIAILGWGSLIWNPKSLNYKSEIGWQKDGPILPLEFARISKDQHLTLVITPDGTKVQTLYSISNLNKLEEAIMNLKMREGNEKTPIGSFIKFNSISHTKNVEQLASIKEWIEEKKNIDAVIWTDLGEKWKCNNGVVIDKNKRVDYLKNLEPITKKTAEEYIRKAPLQINTKYRQQIEKELNWHPIIP